MAKMSILFDGFDDLAYAVSTCLGDEVLHKAVDEALVDTQKAVKNQLEPAAAVYAKKGGGRKGYATGKMSDSMITDTRITWSGSIAEVNTGFSTNGGKTRLGFMHSLFVMYGTPRMSKDPKIFNAIKGSKVKKDIAKVQQEAMGKYINLDYDKR